MWQILKMMNKDGLLFTSNLDFVDKEMNIFNDEMYIFNHVQPLSCTNYSMKYHRHSRNDSDGLKYIIPYFQKENYSVEYD